MDASVDLATGLLVEVQRRRSELRASMSQLELALASAARAGGTASWAERLRAALTGLYDEFAEHVAITEGPDGLYQELARHSPRLVHVVERLTTEHAEIVRRTEELLTWTDVTAEVPDVAEVRRTGTELLAALMRHRQRGADLVFEAYDFDIGGET